MADTKETLCPNCQRLERRVTQLENELRMAGTQLALALHRIENLEDRLRQNSQNSSRPPSSDPPSAPARPGKEPSGRKPGGQPGHPGTARDLVPADQVDKVVPAKPATCACCGLPLKGEDPTPVRRQMCDIPEIKPRITEYQLHTLVCEHCGASTAGEWPEGMPPGAFGPILTAVVALLTGAYHLSKRDVEQLMSDLFHAPMGLGSVPACEKVASAAMAEAVEEARSFAVQAPVANADETGWKEKNKTAWLWTLRTSLVTVFMIHASRGREAVEKLLGSFSGVLVSDRWHAYNWYKGLRQWCWAHLRRDFTAFSEHPGKGGRIGRRLLKKTHLLFHWWHRVRDGTLKRKTFQCRMKPLRREVEALLRQGTTCGQANTERACKRVLKGAAALWTFVDAEGVEPTNNAAERGVRPGVLWRRISFGTQSEAGSRFAERILTVAATCRQQERNALDFIIEAIVAHIHGRPAPSLLPVSESILAQSA